MIFLGMIEAWLHSVTAQTNVTAFDAMLRAYLHWSNWNAKSASDDSCVAYFAQFEFEFSREFESGVVSI